MNKSGPGLFEAVIESWRLVIANAGALARIALVPFLLFIALHRLEATFEPEGMAILIWALDKSLSGPEGFAAVQECLANPLSKLVIWVVVAALIYHSLAGVKHLVMDFGVGETMEGGIMGVRIVIALTVVLTILAGVAIW